MGLFLALILSFIYQNAFATTIHDIVNQESADSREMLLQRKESRPKLMKVPSYTFTQGENSAAYLNIVRTDRDITFLSPYPEGFLTSIKTGTPFHFTGNSPNLPYSQDLIMELSGALTPSFLGKFSSIIYCATFFPSLKEEMKNLISIVLPTGGIDANTRNLIKTFNEQGWHVVVPHSEKSRFTTGSETKADQLKLSGLSCFWDILDSAETVSTYLPIKQHFFYGASRGATVLQYGLMTDLLERYFPKINLMKVFYSDLLPLVQPNDMDIKKPKPYKETFFMGQKDNLNDPKILEFYRKRLESSNPLLSSDLSSNKIYFYEDASHYFSNLTLQEEVKTFTSYNSVCLVMRDSLKDFNGENYFPFLLKLIRLKNTPQFVTAIKMNDEKALTDLLASQQEAALALKFIQNLPGENPLDMLIEENFMNLVWTLLPHTLKGFSMIGSKEYKGDDVHPYEHWTKLSSYFLGPDSLLEKRPVTFKADLTTRNQHIEDVIDNLNDMTLSALLSPSISVLRKGSERKKI